MAKIEYAGASYLDEVKTRFEKSDPDKLTAFYKIFQDCALKMAEEYPTGGPEVSERMNMYMRSELAILFADEPELVKGYDEFWKAAKETETEMSGPEKEFTNKVKLRFENDPDRMAAFYAPFNEVTKQMLADPPIKNGQEAWEEMYEKVKAALEGEPDLVKDFEVFYERTMVNMAAMKATAEAAEKTL